jgi:hypothetical protein
MRWRLTVDFAVFADDGSLEDENKTIERLLQRRV